MSCREVVELVTDYLEHSLPADRCARFEEHLVMCEWCRDYLGQFERTIDLAGRLREPDLSDRLRGVLMDAFLGRRAERG
jgi:predicted anti-sigma-YlaC factor YlaD